METLTNWRSKITFGKYNGMTVEDVLTLNPGYLEWLIEKKNRTNFCQDTIDTIFEAANEEDINDPFWGMSFGDFQT